MVENVLDKTGAITATGSWYTTPLTYDSFEPPKNKKEIKMSEEFCTALTTRSTAFPKGGGDPIAASVPGYSNIPFTSTIVTLIGLENGISYAKTVEEKHNMAFNYKHILVCWPGLYSQDIFYVDDLDALKKALGFIPKVEKTRKDIKGNEWIIG